jgi:uncharacterized protein YaaR (DUF327 family)
MAKVDASDIPSFYMNPGAYAQKPDSKKTKGLKRSGKSDFSRLFEDIRGKTADELGPLRDLPVSEETINLLMDEVRSAGDALQERPCEDEIMRYKQAVRNFMNYVVENSLALEHEEGIPKFPRPGIKEQKRYTKIQIIDKKLEDLAAMILVSQRNQIALAARLEEIQGLLVDLLAG